MTVKSESRADCIKDGWKYDFPLGGNIGVDVKVPIVAGLYVKPGVGGLYMKDYSKKEKYTEGTERRYNLDKHSYVNYKYERTSRASDRSDIISMLVPLTLGYSFSLSRTASVSVGAMGYGSCALMLRNATDSEYINRTTPFDKYYYKHNHDKKTVDVLKDVKFKDRLSYGIGGEAELALGAFFTRYSLRYPITDSKTDYTLYHDLSVGVYF